MNNAGQIIITLIGLIISGGLFSFIQFLINRKDSKNDKFKTFEDMINKGLDEREKVGLARYEEHKENIKKLNDAIVQLTENDTEICQYMQYVGAELMGLAHDRLVYLTDKIAKRNAITLKEKATLDAIYKPYHDGLGGNGDGQMGYEHCMNLSVIPDSLAEELDKTKKSYQIK